MHGRAVPSHVRDGVGAPLTPRCMVEAGLEVRCRAHVAVSDEGAVTDSRILRNALEASNNAQMRDGLHLLGRFTQSSMWLFADEGVAAGGGVGASVRG